MRTFGLFFIALISLIPFYATLNAGQERDYRNEIDSLLNKLRPVEQTKGRNIVVQSPGSDTQQRVSDELLQIANESSQSRSQVVEALIRVLEESPSAEESLIAYRWTTAVNLLGDLRAIEASEAKR